MTTISFDELQRDPSVWLRRVQAGESFVIVQANRPVAEIRPVALGSPLPRPSGLCQGEFVVPDDFNAPLPASVEREFEGS
jgi:antitoxin (DNA-binding transcriptional repressor) of toxin-antitoxin stability system